MTDYSDAIVVIPSILGNIKQAEKIVNFYNAKLTVFLGDYFMPATNMSNCESTIEWLEENLTKPDRVYLIGNRDLGFLFPNNNVIAGSVLPEITRDYIYNKLSQASIDAFKLFHYEKDENVLFSHAGVNQKLFNVKLNKMTDFLEMLKCHADAGMESARSNAGNYPVWWQDLDYGQMPRKEQGGLTGLSWHRLTPLESYHQIVSSSAVNLPEMKYGTYNQNYRQSLNRSVSINLNAPSKMAYGMVKDKKVATYITDSANAAYRLLQTIYLY